MGYTTYEDYTGLFGDIPESTFARLNIEASRLLDIATTGIDNVKKLREAMPTDAADRQVIHYCCGKIISILNTVEQAQANATGYTETANGLMPNVISSISAGNESVSFSDSAGSSGYGALATDKATQDKLVSDTITDLLSGIEDANGVNLLYMGRYPDV